MRAKHDNGRMPAFGLNFAVQYTTLLKAAHCDIDIVFGVERMAT